ncbi:MAG: peptidase M24, structural domain-containing protein [Olpidium bornovanus]|uniref:Probable metalloprotease ARX1 n=1 Tax=Olpidium bornovanus TaxID=278681 RepID=A0A8H7ZQI0_9FUNG|nr:MAG: peptidase M24, structural domain-containing protein [Olpidium bornovanus]
MRGSQTDNVYKRSAIEKGVAVPTTVCVNGTALHSAPSSLDKTVLTQGDVVKIELGVHIDGYISTAAHTIVINERPADPLTGRGADAVCAAHYAFQSALRTIAPGVTSREIVKAIRQAAALFCCVPVFGPVVTQIRRFIGAGKKQISVPNTEDEDAITVGDADGDEMVVLREGEAYVVDVLVTTATSGALKEASDGISDTTIFRRDVHACYNLKLQASRKVFNEVRERFGVFPFSTGAFNDKRIARLGLPECINHGLMQPLPVLVAPKSEIVARFKATILLHASGPTRAILLNPPFPLPYVHSDFSVPPESTVGKIMAASESAGLRALSLRANNQIADIAARVSDEVVAALCEDSASAEDASDDVEMG